MAIDRIVLGTVALGLPYGLPPAGTTAPVLVDEAVAAGLIDAARQGGIDVFDTAPAYGVAEERLGRALGPAGTVWTKVDARLTAVDDLPVRVPASLDASLVRLRRGRLDLLQWHNWTAALGAHAGWRQAWQAVTADPRVAARGCSTYGVDDAVAAVTSGWFQVVQVEGNLLNPRVLDALVEPARRNGVTIAVRSVFLQGVLTPKGTALPPHLAALGPARERAAARAAALSLPLHHLALRAILDHPVAPRVLVGLDGLDQLADTMAAATRVPLSAREQAALADLAVDPALTDPRTWGRP